MGTEDNKIIIPVDFGDQAMIALKQSFNLAKLTGGELVLVYVIDDDFLSSFTDFASKGDDFESQLRKDVSNKLNDIADNVRKETGLKVTTEILTGKVYEEIVTFADDQNASLIIMGTQGPIGLKKRFLGSNASRVVRAANCPVITIKGKLHRTGCKHILLPLDLTKETKEKVNKAIDLAKLFGSQIHIMSMIEDDDEFIVNKLTRQMNQVSDFIADAGVDCSTELIKGSDVAEEVVNAAERLEADLIMIMTQQEVGWVDFFLAPSAQDIINLSEIPVLAIRPMKRKDTTEFMIT